MVKHKMLTRLKGCVGFSPENGASKRVVSRKGRDAPFFGSENIPKIAVACPGVKCQDT